ncbi:hypothetical protein METBIDRAFT_15483, partial [Metschnikowia bicuspidata var. bicuspidata NRRL YB-4993]
MPGDLNLKKSWNPALMKNQKKVWEREQQALAELQSIKQRQKEIAQEREKEHMIRLQYGSDPSSMPTKDKLELNKLGWMYNDGPKTTADDGSGFREVDEDFLARSDEIQLLVRGNKAVQPAVGSRFEKVAAVGRLAPSALLSDDPLLLIRREHFKKRADNRDRSPSRLHGEGSSRTLHDSRSRHRDSRERKEGRDRPGDRRGHGRDSRSHRS